MVEFQNKFFLVKEKFNMFGKINYYQFLSPTLRLSVEGMGVWTTCVWISTISENFWVRHLFQKSLRNTTHTYITLYLYQKYRNRRRWWNFKFAQKICNRNHTFSFITLFYEAFSITHNILYISAKFQKVPGDINNFVIWKYCTSKSFRINYKDGWF